MNEDQHTLSRRHFFVRSGAAILTTGLLTSCESLISDILPSKDKPKDALPERDKTLAFFGDSLTIGAGGSAPYGTLVGAALPGRPIVSDGIVGQIALSISIRQGGTPLIISVEGNKFKGAEPVKVTKLNNEFLSTPINYETYKRTGKIAGVVCTITRTASSDVGESYTITPDAASDAEIPADSEFVLTDTIPLKTATQILWFGRNNIGKDGAEQEILDSLDKSVAYITEPRRYLVLGVLLAVPEIKGTDRYNQVTGINEKLSAKYGNAFVPMTPPTAEEMAAINYSPTDEDRRDLENLNWPTGMRPADKTDDIHINDIGYQIVANRVVEKIKGIRD